MDGTDLTAFLREQRQRAAASRAPLAGVRVLDLGSVVAAPFGATLLGDYGAEVIKIERPGVPDAIRYWKVIEGRYEAYWLFASRNKLPITLNLKHPEGQEIFRRLVREADVLLENMRPGTLDRLGFSAARLWDINRGLVIGRISGYGQTGPSAAKPGFGTLAEAMSGFTYMNAHPGAPPTNPPLALADMIAGVHLALGVVMALRGQKRGERGGQELDLSLYEPLFGFMAGDFLMHALSGVPPEPTGNESHYVCPRNSYQTGDGKWVVLSASSQAPFERLMDLVGRPELKTARGFRNNQERLRPESRELLNGIIGGWIGARPMREVLGACEQAGVTIGPVLGMPEIAADPHVQARGTVVPVNDPTTASAIPLPAPAIRMSATPGEVRFPGLPMGAANEVVLTDLLGYRPDDVARLKATGAM
jgi:crotonobetainyl-CoA:carnitine CoA-transferase CaiB-like acyl-CoA transferase